MQLRQEAGLALRNISIIPRMPELVLGVRELFRNSAVTHSSTGSTYPQANKQTPTHTHTCSVKHTVAKCDSHAYTSMHMHIREHICKCTHIHEHLDT